MIFTNAVALEQCRHIEGGSHLGHITNPSQQNNSTAGNFYQYRLYTSWIFVIPNIYGLTRVPYPMANPTASETTQATSPAPYPITTPSSTSAAWAAKGAMAVAKAATAAAFWSFTEVSDSLGTAARGLTARTEGDRVVGATGAKAVVTATMAARRRATVWQLFILNSLWVG